jgi:polysaccharide chain length determinant protein (PEP-CTERM system associated)
MAAAQVPPIALPQPAPAPAPLRLAGHLPALDGVRGLAVLAVLSFHFVAQTTATSAAEAAAVAVFSYGLLGVELFFVLSGFLITGILYDSRAEPGYYRTFYMRRVLRIFPLYYAVLAVVFLVLPLLPALHGSEIARLREHQAWAWLYAVNVYLALQGAWSLSYLQHLWSLAVEEHFYLLWPVVVRLLGGRPRALLGACLGLALGAFASRTAAALLGANAVATAVLTPFHADALCLGAFFAVWLRQPGGEAAVRRVLRPLGLAAAAWLAADLTWQRLGAPGLELARAARGGLFRLGCTLLLLAVLLAPPSSWLGRGFRSRPLAALGQHSYGIYVYHHFLSYYFVSHGTEFALARVVGSHTLAVALQAAAGTAVSWGAAWLSYQAWRSASCSSSASGLPGGMRDEHADGVGGGVGAGVAARGGGGRGGSGPGRIRHRPGRRAAGRGLEGARPDRRRGGAARRPHHPAAAGRRVRRGHHPLAARRGAGARLRPAGGGGAGHRQRQPGGERAGLRGGRGGATRRVPPRGPAHRAPGAGPGRRVQGLRQGREHRGGEGGPDHDPVQLQAGRGGQGRFPQRAAGGRRHHRGPMSGARRAVPPASAGADYADGDDREDSLRWSQLRHFLHAPLRRPLLVAVPWAAVILLSVAALAVLPKKYMSSALVLVESEKVPESFIPKVATRDAGQRLEAVRPEILSRTRLERVLDETRPYPRLGRTQAVERMRSSIFINLSGNDGFTITFYHRDPLKAQEVTDRLARLFIDETVKSRAQQVEGAVDFLVTQVTAAREELERKDGALRRYKEARLGRLPEQLETNLATLQLLQRELQAVEESLLFAREKQEALARGVARAGAAARPAAPPAGGAAELEELDRHLASLRSRYTDQHPDVESARARLARVRARLAEARAPEPAGAGGDADVELAREQLEGAGLEVRKLEDRQRDLQGRIAAVRADVAETPRTEQELATLTRDYKKLDENYTALLAKQLEAQMSGRLEQRWKGDRFRMLDPASLAEKPVFPQPALFIGLGAMVGLMLGLALAAAAEYLDPTVKDSEVLQAVQGYPVLAVVPPLPEAAAGPVRARLARSDPSAPEATPVPEAGDAPAWGDPLPGEAPFRYEGAVSPRRTAPIVESLEDHHSVVGEELRLFGANLLDLCRRAPGLRCVAVSSALPGEGKSTLSLGLASALGREPGRRVLLVEADLRRPSLTHTLGLPPAHGLGEWLNGTLGYVPVRAVEPGGFFLVAAGQAGLRRPELLGSPRLDALLRAARRHFDLVLLDAVPILPVADTVLMQDLVDGFQLVVRSRQTPRDAIRDALAKLRPDRVVGVVFNGHREYGSSYRAYGYRRYGMDPAPTEPGGALAWLTSRLPFRRGALLQKRALRQ